MEEQIRDEERNRRPSLFSDNLLNQVNEKVLENCRFTISELSDHFPLNFSESFTRDCDRKNRLLHALSSSGIKTTYQWPQNEKNEFCHRLYHFEGEELWILRAVNAMGTYCYIQWYIWATQGEGWGLETYLTRSSVPSWCSVLDSWVLAQDSDAGLEGVVCVYVVVWLY